MAIPAPPTPPPGGTGESGQYQAIIIISSHLELQDLVQQRCRGAVFILGRKALTEARWSQAYTRILNVCE